MTAKLPFYANMFSAAGFPLTSDQTVRDVLVDSLVISGNEATVVPQFTELLVTGLDELMVSLVPTAGAGNDSSYFWLDIKIEISKLCLTVSAKFYRLPVGRHHRSIKGLD